MLTPTHSHNSDQLDAVVADYLQQVEAGTPPDRDALVAAHPNLADRLRAYFADLDRMGKHGESFRLPVVALPEDFGDYEFLGEIGRGGMGVVYRVRQKTLGRVVALKMILSGPLASADVVRRFRDEAETVARLDHPNVVPVYEVGEHAGVPFFTMRLVEGQGLTRCFEGCANALGAAAELLIKVCDAVHHAHQRGVLHRDLKPRNILVDEAGAPHVTDFGLSRRVEESRGLTATSTVLGTPEYMAPEQAAGASDPTVAVDVYGLGAVLYFLLTARPPFQAATPYETVRRVVEDVPVPPRTIRPNVPRDLETICLKCLEKNPARRYASAEALAEDLRRWSQGNPILARPAGRVERVAKWARRRPTAAALLLGSLVSAALVLGGGPVLAWRLSRALDDSREKGSKLEVSLADANEQRGIAETNGRKLAEALRDARRDLFTNQLLRVGGVYREDPDRALDLLHDYDACPIDLRDAAWTYYARACERLRAPTQVSTFYLDRREEDRVQIDTQGRAVTYSWTERTVTVRDVTAGRKIGETSLTDPKARIEWVYALGPDGKTALVETNRGLRRLGLGTGVLEASPVRFPTFPRNVVSPSLDGKLIGVSGEKQGDPPTEGVRILDAVTGEERGFVACGPVKYFDVAPGGATLIVGQDEPPDLDPDAGRIAVRRGDGGPPVRRLLSVPSGKQLFRLRTDGWAPASAFSLDGRFYAAAPSGGTISPSRIVLWDIRAGREVTIAAPELFKSLAFSLDGNTLAGGTFAQNGVIPGRVYVFDAPSGRLRGRYTPISADGAGWVGIAPGGRLAAVAGDRHFTWPLERDAEPVFLPDRLAIDLSPDGRLAFVLVRHDQTRPETWNAKAGSVIDTRTGKPVLELPPGFDFGWLPAYCRFIFDGKRFELNYHGQTWEWDLGATPPHLVAKRSQPAPVPAGGPGPEPEPIDGWRRVRGWTAPDGKPLAVSPDGRTDVRTDAAGAATLCDAATGRERATLDGLRGYVWGARFSQDGQTLGVQLASGAAFYDLRPPAEYARVLGRAVAFRPDGDQLAVMEGTRLTFVDIQTGGPAAAVGHSLVSGQWHPPDQGFALGYSARGNLIGVRRTRGSELSLTVFDTGSGRQVFKGVGPGAFHPRADLLAVAHQVLATDTEKLSIRDDLLPVAEGLARRGLSADRGTLSPLVPGPPDARVWEVLLPVHGRRANGAENPSASYRQPLAQVIPEEDALLLLDSGTAEWWDLSSGVRRRRLDRPWGRPLAIRPDGKALATVSGKDTRIVRLIDLATGDGRDLFPVRPDAQYAEAAFSPDGQLLLIGEKMMLTSHVEFTLWDVTAGRRVASVREGKAFAGTPVFSPDGRFLAMVALNMGGRGMVRVWDVRRLLENSPPE